MKLFDEIPCLEDDYLTLHRMTEADAPVLEEMSKNEAVTRYLPADLFEYGFADKKEAIREMYQGIFERKESLLLGVYLKEAPEQLAGVCEFYNYEPFWNKASIGVRLNESCWNKGIGERTISLMKDYLFQQTDVKRITAHVMTANTYSQRAIQKQGFRLRKSNAPEDWGHPEKVKVNKFVLEKIGNIKYAKVGNGPKTMVILPGLSFKSVLGSADLVENAYGNLFKDYTIYVFDDRTNIRGGYSIRERVGDVAAEMRTLHIKGAYVFGASMGGMMGQYLAIDHPNLVKKLVLTATTSVLCPEARQVVEKWKTLAENGEREKLIEVAVKDIYSPATIEQFGDVLVTAVGYITDKELSDFVALTKAILAFDCTEEMSRIQCPVLVTGAYGDKVLFPESQLKIAEKLGCEIHMYGPELGHAVYDEATDHKQRILDFFEKSL